MHAPVGVSGLCAENRELPDMPKATTIRVLWRRFRDASRYDPGSFMFVHGDEIVDARWCNLKDYDIRDGSVLRVNPRSQQ
jgi:hypothetical protein